MTRGLDQDLGSPGGGKLEVMESDHVGVQSGGQQGEVVEHALVNRVPELWACPGGSVITQKLTKIYLTYNEKTGMARTPSQTLKVD